ncbi:MAG: M48 family metalloprotease [Vicinamibacterales bacterium]
MALAAMSVPVIALAATSALAKTRHGKVSDTRERGREGSTRRLQEVVDAIRARLGIERAVGVTVVDRNPYFVSVIAPREKDGPFTVEVEETMLNLLADDELEAALAHELGHVWVFTHHPYLQTELLANQIALKTVSRDALMRVYQKVWERNGMKGDVTAFLGAAPPQ